MTVNPVEDATLREVLDDERATAGVRRRTRVSRKLADGPPPAPRPPCPVCGPQPAPVMHTLCHAVPGLRRWGCGHRLRDHSAGLRCRICQNDCGHDGPRPIVTVSGP